MSGNSRRWSPKRFGVEADFCVEVSTAPISIDAVDTRRFAPRGGPFDFAQGKLRPPLHDPLLLFASPFTKLAPSSAEVCVPCPLGPRS
jgi:hypothetical protein